MTILFFILTTAAAAFVQASTGFGFGIFVMMFFPQFLPSYGMSVTMSGMLSLETTAVTSIQYRRHIAWKKLLWPTVCYIAVSTAAILLSAGQADSLMKRLLGAVLVVLSVWFLFFGKRVRIRPTPAAGIIAGSLSGLLSDLFSIGGPPMVVYLLSGADSKDEYLATIQTYFTVTNIYALIVRAAAGLVTFETLRYALIGAGGIALGVYLGRRVFRSLNADRLRVAVYLFMAVSGVITLIRG